MWLHSPARRFRESRGCAAPPRDGGLVRGLAREQESRSSSLEVARATSPRNRFRAAGAAASAAYDTASRDPYYVPRVTYPVDFHADEATEPSVARVAAGVALSYRNGGVMSSHLSRTL